MTEQDASRQLATGPMGSDEARVKTDEAKASADKLWALLLELYNRDAWKALGYGSWGSYFEAELGGGDRSHGYRLLNAGRVLEALEPAGFHNDGSPGSPLLNEATARELAPILRNGADAVREAWEEAVDEHGPTPTATQVRETVQKLQEPRQQPGDTSHLPRPRVRMPDWTARLHNLHQELDIARATVPLIEPDQARTIRDLCLQLAEDMTPLANTETGTAG